MELRQINYFIAVAETTSLTKAAGRLHIAQPALSQNIKNLEEELDTRLFERSRQGMALTDSGVAFLEHARGLIRQVNRAKESVRDLDDNPSGTVSVAMPASVANVLAVPLFQLLKKNYPAIELNLDEGLTGNIRQAFEMGLYDIILGLNEDKTDNLSIERLIREDLYFISQYSGGDRNTAEIDFLDLALYPIIISQVQHSMGQTVMKYAQEQNLDLKIISSNTALHPAIKLIEAGIGHGISPWSAIYEKYEQELICARKIINPCMHRTVSMLSPSNRPRTIATLKVMELIRQTVKLAHSLDEWRGELLFNE
ncbi:MAG: LysR family transcriptional regulator [Porticoccaceae bacterium]|nr:LysR family transcriptional regulator [Porticoccaceae bacterium]